MNEGRPVLLATPKIVVLIFARRLSCMLCDVVM